MTNFEKVKEFHRAYGQPVGQEPRLLERDRYVLRTRLIGEEFDEFVDSVEEKDLTNAAKELADLLYVAYGTAVEMGVDIDAVFDAVHESNMSKLDEDGKPIYREDGKVIKGPFYREPDIATVLGI